MAKLHKLLISQICITYLLGCDIFAKNIIVNDFEHDQSGTQPAGLNVIFTPDDAGSTVMVDDSTSGSGKQSVKLSISKKDNRIFFQYINQPLKIGQKYQINFRAKASQNGLVIKAVLIQIKVDNVAQYITLTSEWKEYTVVLQPEKNSANNMQVLRFQCSGIGTVWLDDICFSEIEKSEYTSSAKTSRNLIPNSSFEIATCADVPDCYDNYLAPKTSLLFGKWFDYWQLDHSMAYHGKSSMKIIIPGPDLVDEIKLMSTRGDSKMWQGIDKDKVYTMSAYLKGDKDGLSAFIGMRMADKQGIDVKINTKWQRFSFSGKLKPLGDLMLLNIQLKEPGALWIDALQLEEGEKLSEYEISAKDSGLFAYPYIEDGENAASGGSSERIGCKILSMEPVIDGGMEEVWKNALCIKNLNPFGKTRDIINKTEVYIGQYKDALYILAKCYDSDIKNIMANINDRDGEIWKDDCFEVFIDPYLDRRNYVHLGVNSLGTQYDCWGKSKKDWTADWQVKCSKSEDYWLCEMKIPFSIFPRISRINSSLGISVCREAKQPMENSAWGGGFHNVSEFTELYGLEIPEKYTYLFKTSKPVMVYIKGDKSRIKISVENMNEKDFHCTARLQLTDKTGKTISSSQALVLSKKSVITLLYEGIDSNNKDMFPYTAELALIEQNNNELFISSKEMINFCEPVVITTEKDYYTGETEAVMRLTANIIPEQDKPYSIYISIQSGSKTVKSLENYIIKNAGAYKIILPISDIEKPENIINLKMFSPEKRLIFQNSVPLRKYKPNANEVKINKFYSCLLVDGKPFFPVTACILRVYLIKEKWDEMLKWISDQGFNSVNPTFRHAEKAEGAEDREILEFFDLCKKYNLKVIVWNNPNPARNIDGNLVRIGQLQDIQKEAMYREKEMLRLITLTKDHPAVLSYYYWDEPGSEEYGICNSIFSNMKKLDPYHPATVNLTSSYIWQISSERTDFPADIASLTEYPIGRYNAAVVADDIAQLYRISGNAPVHPWLQFYSGHGRYPTQEEMLCMAYLSIINNATGLKFWPLVPCSRLLWDTAKQISEEINLLKEYLFTYKTSETFTIDDGKICVRILDFPDKMLAVTANRRGMLRNAIFDLSMFGAYENKKCKILFENRELILKNNKIADTFKPYERHIYLISK